MLSAASNKLPKLLPTVTIFELKMHKNAFAIGARPRNPIRSLKRSPDPLARFRERGEGENQKEGRGKKWIGWRKRR